jgi:hypothetical protein
LEFFNSFSFSIFVFISLYFIILIYSSCSSFCFILSSFFSVFRIVNVFLLFLNYCICQTWTTFPGNTLFNAAIEEVIVFESNLYAAGLFSTPFNYISFYNSSGWVFSHSILFFFFFYSDFILYYFLLIFSFFQFQLENGLSCTGCSSTPGVFHLLVNGSDLFIGTCFVFLLSLCECY